MSLDQFRPKDVQPANPLEALRTQHLQEVGLVGILPSS